MDKYICKPRSVRIAVGTWSWIINSEYPRNSYYFLFRFFMNNINFLLTSLSTVSLALTFVTGTGFKRELICGIPAILLLVLFIVFPFLTGCVYLLCICFLIFMQDRYLCLWCTHLYYYLFFECQMASSSDWTWTIMVSILCFVAAINWFH